MVVVPAFMELFGDANWWLPRWLDRILPRVSVDVEHVGAELVDVARAEIAPVEAAQVGAEPASGNGRRRPTSKAKPKAPARKAKPAARAKAKAKPKAAAGKAKGKPKPAATRKRTPPRGR